MRTVISCSESASRFLRGSPGKSPEGVGDRGRGSGPGHVASIPHVPWRAPERFLPAARLISAASLRFCAFHYQGPKRRADPGGGRAIRPGRACRRARAESGLGGARPPPPPAPARGQAVLRGSPAAPRPQASGFRSRKLKREVRSVLFKLCSFFKANITHVYK